MMSTYSLLLVGLGLFVGQVSACGAGGLGAPTSGALIALCVVFLPVIIPVVAVGGPTYLAYQGIKKGSHAIQKKHERNKKRNSDIIKTQMSRAVKLLGKDKFLAHIQQLYDKAKTNPSNQSFFELGVALFLSKDLMGAEEYLTKALKDNTTRFDSKSHCFFVRGLVNQYTQDFIQAAEDFKNAILLFEQNPTVPEVELDGADVKADSLPRLTAFDAHNSYGFANALRALYTDDIDDTLQASLLDTAIEEYTIALDGVSVKQGMWYHNRGVSRYFRTYCKEYTEEEIQQELNLALQDFKDATNSGNFGTAADGYAMIAQTLARLKRPEAEIEEYINLAYDADPKVFMVDVTSEYELMTPWVLPVQDYPFRKSPHEFEKVHFKKPTWCSHCMGFIQNPVGKQGYQCSKCKYRVHSKCFPQVKGKNCWNDEMRFAVAEEGAAHTHHMKLVHFHKPTWCDHCTKFVKSPVGKQGYNCTDCGFKVHKECISNVANYIES